MPYSLELLKLVKRYEGGEKDSTIDINANAHQEMRKSTNTSNREMVLEFLATKKLEVFNVGN